VQACRQPDAKTAIGQVSRAALEDGHGAAHQGQRDGRCATGDAAADDRDPATTYLGTHEINIISTSLSADTQLT
jgi:hypothetical protein